MLDRFSYDVIITHCDVLSILFLFIFVANAQDLVGQFSSNYEQKRSYEDLFAAGKNDHPQTYMGLK